MLVDRHHVQYLIELGKLAHEATAAVLAERKEGVDAFLGTLGGSASPTARAAFEARMRSQADGDGPWAAVRVAGLAGRLTTEAGVRGPPAAVLVLNQVDDDPDGEEDGNRLPDAASWAPLREALERWDTDVIRAWTGPLGWQPPAASPSLDPDPEVGAAPYAAVASPGPASPVHAASLAAQEADARSQRALRTIGTVAAAGGAGGLLFSLGRALGRSATKPATDTAKGPTS